MMWASRLSDWSTHSRGACGDHLEVSRGPCVFSKGFLVPSSPPSGACKGPCQRGACRWDSSPTLTCRVSFEETGPWRSALRALQVLFDEFKEVAFRVKVSFHALQAETSRPRLPQSTRGGVCKANRPTSVLQPCSPFQT